jgi:hypothetical protein
MRVHALFRLDVEPLGARVVEDEVRAHAAVLDNDARAADQAARVVVHRERVDVLDPASRKVTTGSDSSR